jgi:hypothetical protein
VLIPPENVKVIAVQIELCVAENVTDESKEEEAIERDMKNKRPSHSNSKSSTNETAK